MPQRIYVGAEVEEVFLVEVQACGRRPYFSAVVAGLGLGKALFDLHHGSPPSPAFSHFNLAD
jgi:hypothetical protein